MKKGQQYANPLIQSDPKPSPRSIERAAGTLDWVDNFKPPPPPSKAVIAIVQHVQQNYAIGADIWQRDNPKLDFQQYAQDRLRAYRAEWDDPRSTIKVDQPEFAKYAGFRAGQDQLKAIADVADSRTIGDIAGDSVKAAARGISRLVYDASLLTAPLNPVMLYQDLDGGIGTAQRIALRDRQSSDDFYNNAQSDGLKAQKARFASRTDRDVAGTVQAAIDNPGVIGDIASEQTGPALLTGLGGKALQTTGASARALSAFGLGSEVTQSGLSTYGQALQDGAKPGDALLASAQAMLTTGLIGKTLGDGSRLARALEHAPGKYSMGAHACRHAGARAVERSRTGSAGR
ncbi:hypothetical protein IGB42_02853 [Andreprevotia sp. IGB-42]|uniref:hypothetical protein n=1 Tax=Andreprevotia sp. IGB-42 TaxID=2497473 RepID=UPI00135CEDC2|nr:hypothetical protein [Andreprevotia sp. IGB-42]KAF0812564.1 hypothetical protein IGB42_02853 [Andreprevotia sp. IGB-42]